jgi:ssDNA-binding Zn-finger/Zn-ribbon topoisomerase 1
MLWQRTSRLLEERRRVTAPCPHGVGGGYDLGTCPKCLQDREKQEEKRRRAKIEAERRRKVEEKAKALRTEQLKKATKLHLRQIDYLLSLSPRDFEEAVALMYRKLGFHVTVTPASNDRGKDAIATRGNEKYVIECKRYERRKRIGRPALQKLFAALTEEHADGGIFVTTAGFTRSAVEYGKMYGIELVDGVRLPTLMYKAFPLDSTERYLEVMCLECEEVVKFTFPPEVAVLKCSAGHEVRLDLDLQEYGPKLLTGKAYCDKCGREMRVVKGWRGPFLGCSGYPKCRNTKSIQRRF